MNSDMDPRRLDFLAVDAIASYLRSKVAVDLRRLCRTCVLCEHFAQNAEECNQVQPPQRPPARIIAFGCERFEEIQPF